MKQTKQEKQFTDLMEKLPRQERFNSAVAVLNTLLIRKGIIGLDEHLAYSIEDMKARVKKRKAVRGE